MTPEDRKLRREREIRAANHNDGLAKRVAFKKYGEEGDRYDKMDAQIYLRASLDRDTDSGWEIGRSLGPEKGKLP